MIRPLSPEDSRAVLAEVGAGRLAMVTPEGPYAVPMLFALDGDALLFYTTPGRKLDALRRHPSGVSMEIDEVGARPDWRSVLVVGRFEEAGDGARDSLRAALQSNHHPYAAQALQDLDQPDTVLARLTLTQLSGRAYQP